MDTPELFGRPAAALHPRLHRAGAHSGTRFLSADPTVEALYNPQDLNRYSYVLNDPLAFTDPSGLCFLGCFWKAPAFREYLSIAFAVVFQQYEVALLGESAAFATSALGTVVNAGIAGGAAGAISTGTLKGAALGALEAGMFAESGKLLEGPKGVTIFGSHDAATLVAHGFVGGIASVAGGHGFASGFLAAGVSSIADIADLDTNNLAANVAEHAVLGGVGSVLGGGKFANGAVTGSFAYLFTAVASGDVEETYKQYAAKLKALGIDPTNTSIIGGSGVIDSITTGSDFTSAAQPIYDQDVGLGQETGGIQVYQAADGSIHVVPFVGGAATCSAAASACMSVPNPDPSQGKLLFEWHPHPNNLSGSDLPSEADLSRSLNLGVPGVIWSNTGGSVPKQVD